MWDARTSQSSCERKRPTLKTGAPPLILRLRASLILMIRDRGKRCTRRGMARRRLIVWRMASTILLARPVDFSFKSRGSPDDPLKAQGAPHRPSLSVTSKYGSSPRQQLRKNRILLQKQPQSTRECQRLIFRITWLSRRVEDSLSRTLRQC